MSLKGTPILAPAGLNGFDIDQPLNITQAQAFVASGMKFVLRYAPRAESSDGGNLTEAEGRILQQAGLAISVVQHCPLPNWSPSGALGAQYGAFGADYVRNIAGILQNIVFWLDLEMVAVSSASSDIVNYCNSWFSAVSVSGLIPGIYVGWQTGLTPEQLYDDLMFEHYWIAYNGDNVATRGFQMVQSSQQILKGVTYDPDVTQTDRLGGNAIWLSPG